MGFDGAWVQPASLLRLIVSLLEWPTIIALLMIFAATLWEVGSALGERWGGMKRLAREGSLLGVETLGRKRIERADLLAKVGPMLGLMGTLIPLGPGLAALGKGDLELLARSVTVSFDTTVMGLVVGITGFVLGRLRRRWYDQCLDKIEQRMQQGIKVELA